MISNERNQFIGAHTTREVREALEKEARQRRKGMSRIIHEALVEKLSASGHKFKGAPEEETTK